MIGKGWTDFQIRMACAPYCDDKADDQDLDPLIDGGRKKFNKPEPPPVTGNETDVARLNRKHAVLPIGGKTRVVTFGELPEFPGRETIVMTQTFDDFKALNDRYRHSYVDAKGQQQETPMGTHWIAS